MSEVPLYGDPYFQDMHGEHVSIPDVQFEGKGPQLRIPRSSLPSECWEGSRY